MKFLFPLFNISLFALFSLQAQNTQISGQIISEGELEGIHVINSCLLYTSDAADE